ncbi:solute carrier family 26 member 6 [Erpetoichthys calabaricus]|uniref:solute carrier family 26 member 6 n=1 Tax=Erpetoichthys calabaricus TaxID=27687 RepID=UPI002234E874|nr:solute carrier family 26 member 6 [Erpetoichthys calabaricus]
MERADHMKHRLNYSVERAVMDEECLQEVAHRHPRSSPSYLASRLKRSMRCSVSSVRARAASILPVFSWLPHYSRAWAVSDFISGISGGIMHLPQGMAYALLASVPPVYGLYSSFYPILVYFIFGTSKHISVGTFAVMSVMMGSVAEKLVAENHFSTKHNVTNLTTEDVGALTEERVEVVVALTFLCGLFQVCMGLARFGFVAIYLSDPVVRGFTTATAIHVMVSQLKYVFGVSPKRYSGPLSLLYTIVDVCILLPQTNLGPLVVFMISTAVLIIVKQLNNTWHHRLRVPIPGELLMVIVATVVSAYVNLDKRFGVETVGEIPSGLRPPTLPDVTLFKDLYADAFIVAIVGYSMVISLGRAFAGKYHYRVDSNQELLALGLSNIVGGLFQCFAVSCSMSRSLVQEASGGRTQVAGAISALFILVIILKVGEFFQQLPKAVLASVVIVNLQGMLKQFSDVHTLWRTNRVDMLVWIITLVSTLLLNIDLGLPLAIAFAVLTIIFRTQLPQYSLLGQIPGTDLYRPVEVFSQAKEITGIKIFHSSATLHFANSELYLAKLSEKVKLPAASVSSTNGVVQHGLGSSESLATLPAVPHSIILDLSPVNFLDTVAVKTLKSILNDYGTLGVEVYFASCQACVMKQLEQSDFFTGAVTKRCFFASVHDAVLHIQGLRTERCSNSEVAYETIL